MSLRIARLNELIKEELGQVLLRELEVEGVLLTVTRVETAADAMTAKVFISVFPENQAPRVSRILGRQIYFLQQKLNQRLLMRPVPRLIFCQEKETIKASRVEALLQGIKPSLVEKRRKKR